PRTGGVAKPRALLPGGRVAIHLPAGRGPAARPLAEDRLESLPGEQHLALGPGRVSSGDEVLPAHVVPAVHPDLEPRSAHGAHLAGAASADVRAREHGAVEQRAQSVVSKDGGAPDLPEKIPSEDAFQRAPGMVRAEAEEEARSGAAALEQPGEPGNALARAAEGVDVHLQRELHPTSRRASAIWPR